MALRKILLCILIPVLVNLVSCTPQNRALQGNAPAKIVHVEGKEKMIKLDTDFFSLMKFFAKNLPLTVQKVRAAGFKLDRVPVSFPFPQPGRKDYEGIPVQLNDGTVLYDFYFVDVNNVKETETFFAIDIKNKRIMRSEVEQALGGFELYSVPRGRSIRELFIYTKVMGKSEISAGYSQLDKDLLSSVYFEYVDKHLNVEPID